MLPIFLIGGAQKAGTTYLNNLLAQHPDIFMPEYKEIPYFFDDALFSKGIDHYRNFFSKWNGQKITGNSPAHLLYMAKVSAKRVYEYNKDTKLIFSLRNPIERAYSAYWYARGKFCDESKTFEEALKRESWVRENGTLSQKCELTYLDHGLYFEQIKFFLELFDKSRILFILFNDLVQNPIETYRNILSFLGADQSFVPDVSQKSNVAARPKINFLSKIIYQDSFLKRLYISLFSDGFRYKFRFSFINRISRLNKRPFDKPEMNVSTRLRLREFFHKPNRKLEGLLNLDLSCWH